jgi:SAM-dependent methyltransferase
MSPTLPKPSADYTVRDQERMRYATNYFEWQARMVEPYVGQRVLEIGCGLGNFTRHLVTREFVAGIDVEPACVAAWRSTFSGLTHLTGYNLDATDPAFLDLKQHRPDTVVCLNVLEHIEDDVQALRHMHAVLGPRGRALLIVPAFAGLYGPIDHNLGHYRRYSASGFRQKAQSVGFKARLRYMNTIGLVGWWVNAKLLKRTEQSDSQIQFFDSVIVPVMSRLERAVPPPFGQSLFAVLEK